MHLAWGFLPSSSLSPRALGGGTLVERGQQLRPSHRLAGCGCGAPKGAHCGLETPLLLGSALRAGTLPPPFPSPSKQEARLLWKWYCTPAPFPLLPLSPEQAGLPPRPPRPLEGDAPHGLAWRSGLAAYSPLHPQNQRASQGMGGGGQCPPPYISFCKYSALIKLYGRQVWPHCKRPRASGAVGDRSPGRD